MESVALKVSAVPFATAVGVPLIRPVDEFNVKPLGNVPEVSVHVYGAVPPVAAKACEYGDPTCPFASAVVLMLTAVAAVPAAVAWLELLELPCATTPAHPEHANEVRMRTAVRDTFT